MKIIDISRAVDPAMTVWPGDPGIALRQTAWLDTDGCNVSELCLGVHSGTHVDAPWHFIKQGERIHELDLNCFIGECKVLEIDKPAPQHVTGEDLALLDIKAGDIILIKTRNSRVSDLGVFNMDFCALSLDAAQFLVDRHLKSIGVDYLSIEPFGGNGDVHRCLLENRIGIIEGLNLSGVKPGHYFLSALPLKICGSDGSPVRAVLIDK